MKYTEEMILHSPSGYCMPFEEDKNKEVTMSKGYGEQKDAVTGETFLNHGIDFNAGRASVRTRNVACILSYATANTK